jgi:AcrR family transcriptional regulator
MTEPNLILQEAGEQQQPTRADALKNRVVILKTAMKLFTEKNVHDVTMSDIAEAAEIGKGTLYRHFKDKAQLCQAMLDEDQRNLQDRALEYFRSQGDPLDSLGWFLVEVALFVDRNRPLLCVSSVNMMTLEHSAHWWWRQTIRGLLGQINPPGDVEYLTDLLFVMLDVNTIYFQRKNQGYPIERITDGLLDILHRITR